MAKVPQLIKALLDFSKKIPEQLLAQGYAVLNAITGNTNFPNPPVDLNVLKTTLDAYSVSIGDAKDGSKKAKTLRDRLGEEVIRILRALATYVELNCKDDMNTFLSSGFQSRSSARTPAGPLAQPTLNGINQGVSGQLLASRKSVRNARNYDVRIGQLGPGGVPPANWLMVTVPNAKAAVPFNGLTPGTTYAVQVRAYGASGYTGWSDSMTRMVI
jgi:hypothetical protein